MADVNYWNFKSSLLNYLSIYIFLMIEMQKCAASIYTSGLTHIIERIKGKEYQRLESKIPFFRGGFWTGKF